MKKHEPCWDKPTQTGYFRRINTMVYDQRFKATDGTWNSKAYYVKPKPGTRLFACENCGLVEVRK